ncbi:hypothetical protein DSL72_008064 [Monilinia vaccinii-corymbosi]|uniref:Uncharacterized protein n=1 Tax=Monilinia vaccinii-corymbosi TaxID=61207 RepID=A0A8A3PIN7_9HELO|nr:hypothetical protein DSL72_008064 [Monilinia vaccinii-corymbosi]
MDRNKEMERLRKEHASLSEASSNHATELTELRSHINTLESELSEKSEMLAVYHKDKRVLKAQLSKVPNEMKAIKNYRHDLEAHIATFDANKTSMTIEDNHAEFLSSKRHEYRFKDSSSALPKKIANDPLLSDEGKAICAILQDLRKDNAELRARYLWYWDLFQQPGRAKSLAWDVHESVAEFIPSTNTMEAEDRLKEVEAGRKCGLPSRGPMADAALFELGLLSGPENIVAFKDLYYCEPHAIAAFPREFNEAIGHWATISTTDATPASEKQRAEASECFNSILSMWMDSLTPEDFQASLNSSRGLPLQLRELPKQIVRIDRAGKYRRYVEDKVARAVAWLSWRAEGEPA